MELFMRLVTLPEEEEDLAVIIDKAGDFLIDQEDIENSLALYSAAEKSYPNESTHPHGSGYCLGKLGHFDESVEKNRRAVELNPDNHVYLNDLGYSLLEAKKFDESEKILKKSISKAPADYDLARNNLKRLKEVRKSKKKMI
jgi:Flp pilus assembly protein TadD